VFGFIPLKDSRFAHFNFKRWIFQTEQASSLRFSASLLNVLGTAEAEFFLCNSFSLQQCTSPDSYKNNTQAIKVISQEQVGQKVTFQLEIVEDTLKRVNTVEKEGNIVVRLEVREKAPDSVGYNLVAVELFNNNKVQYLREDRPLEEKLMAHEVKVYKYVNSDPTVKEIRVHVNEISGKVKLSGVIKTDEVSKTITVRPEGRTLRFTASLTSPILVSVQADTRAIFVISMQVILKNEMHDNADVIAMGEDLTYTVRIQPQTFTIFEMTPIYFEFEFKYAASQSVIACAMDPDTGICLDLNDSSTKPHLALQGVVSKAKMTGDRRARIKITNPFSDSIAEVAVIFHSRILNHCDAKQIGKVYS
jgi:hypothetical protein